MSGSLQFVPVGTQPRPEKSPGGRGDDQKRDDLLPIHTGKIVHVIALATTILGLAADFRDSVSRRRHGLVRLAPCPAMSFATHTASLMPNAPLGTTFTMPAISISSKRPGENFSALSVFRCAVCRRQTLRSRPLNRD